MFHVISESSSVSYTMMCQCANILLTRTCYEFRVKRGGLCVVGYVWLVGCGLWVDGDDSWVVVCRLWVMGGF